MTDLLADIIEAVVNPTSYKLYELVALEPHVGVLRADDQELRLPLGALPGGVTVGDLLRVGTKKSRGEDTARQVVEVELDRQASGRPQTSAVQVSLLCVPLAVILAAFAHLLAVVPFSSLDPRVQPLVRYGVMGVLALFTCLCASRTLLDTPPKLEELRNRYGRNDFLLWVLEQPTTEGDHRVVREFRERWEHLRPRPVRAALVGVAVAVIVVALGLPLAYGFVVVTLTCALSEVVRRRVFAHWSAAHKAEVEALVWSEALSPYRDRLASARVQAYRFYHEE